MPLNKSQKQKIVENLKDKIERQKAMVFVDISSLKVKDLSSLRRKMKEQDCELKVAKKTLMSLALKEKKIDFDVEKLKGELALGFGYKDEISPFRILHNFSKEQENLKILAGFIGEFFGKEKAIEIAQLSTKEELLARIIGSIKQPISSFMNVLQENLRSLVYILSAIKK